MGKRGRPRHPDILTPREREALAFIRDGLSNEDIAGHDRWKAELKLSLH